MTPTPVSAPRASPRFTSLPPLALYVHLPWCVRKCPYCDFNSYERDEALSERAYVAALLRDLAAEAPLAQGRALASVFIGGGTPSLFSGEAIAELLAGIRACLPLAAGTEITLEANPGAVEAERFAAYREAGVDRLSIGVQSFRDDELARLGRVHGAAEAERAVAMAHAAGFASVNIDLMYGLPGDDVGGALEDLERAIALSPAHLSWYQLTLEPGTAFHRRPPLGLPDDDVVAEIEDAGRERLAANGYARYEVSAYARPGHRCTHNVNYWEFGDYLGIGAGAHGKVTSIERNEVVRRAKPRNPRTYVVAAGTERNVVVERSDSLAVDYLMNALRLLDGVAIEYFEQRTGTSAREIAAARGEAVRRGWLEPRTDRLQATPQGLNVLNRLLALF